MFNLATVFSLYNFSKIKTREIFQLFKKQTLNLVKLQWPSVFFELDFLSSRWVFQNSIIMCKPHIYTICKKQIEYLQ